MDIGRHVFHVGVVGPLFMYVGLTREATPDAVFNILGLFAFMILGYHSYRAWEKLKDGKSAWVNWIHILIVAPILFILAYMKKSSHPRYYEMLLLLGFAAIGYHAFYLIKESILL
jgi:hypothetical protein